MGSDWQVDNLFATECVGFDEDGSRLNASLKSNGTNIMRKVSVTRRGVLVFFWYNSNADSDPLATWQAGELWLFLLGCRIQSRNGLA